MGLFLTIIKATHIGYDSVPFEYMPKDIKGSKILGLKPMIDGTPITADFITILRAESEIQGLPLGRHATRAERIFRSSDEVLSL